MYSLQSYVRQVLLTIWVVVSLGVSASFSVDLDRGHEAIGMGDYEAAFRELQPLAEQGNPDAQTSIGSLHRNGWGVPVNLPETAEAVTVKMSALDPNASPDFAVTIAGRVLEPGCLSLNFIAKQ